MPMHVRSREDRVKEWQQLRADEQLADADSGFYFLQ